MSTLVKFRCRCKGSTGENRCDAQTTRKTVTCKSCDANCKVNGRKLAKLRWIEKVLVGERTR